MYISEWVKTNEGNEKGKARKSRENGDRREEKRTQKTKGSTRNERKSDRYMRLENNVITKFVNEWKLELTLALTHKQYILGTI